jgi:glycosyltransferase involved in cell wall biosynthesis
MLAACRYDVLWIEKEVFPFLPGVFEALPWALRVPYVVDLDDATFHTYDQHRSVFVRLTLGRKLDPLLRHAHAITVGNSYLGEYVREHGAPRVEAIPTAVDVARYAVQPEPEQGEFRIGWIGTPITTKYLKIVADPLRHMATRRNIRLVTIGASELPDLGVPIEQHAWTADSEAELLSSVHVGIMPLPDEPWERGKSGYKLVQYMAAGRAVVASPVGANREIVSRGVGYLANDASVWVSALCALCDDREARHRMGLAGRLLAEANYSTAVIGPRIRELLWAAMECSANRG